MKFISFYLLATATAEGKRTVNLCKRGSARGLRLDFRKLVSDNSTCTLVNAGCKDFQFIVQINEECRESEYASINASQLYANGNQG